MTGVRNDDNYPVVDDAISHALRGFYDQRHNEHLQRHSEAPSRNDSAK